MVDTSISFMRSLCMGVIEEQVIFPFPRVPEEHKETLHGVIDSLKQLLAPREEDFRKWDRAGEMLRVDARSHDLPARCPRTSWRSSSSSGSSAW